MALKENVAQIQQTISQACQSVGRSLESVNVIAVTKTVSSDMARQVVKCGIHHLAENRVDKLLEKQKSLNDCPAITWHLIGNLQRKKVKTIINRIDYFHALDTIHLAEEIQKRATHKINCFVEVNVSEEESKHGIRVEDVVEFITQMEPFDQIEIVGLMTMAPLDASSDEVVTIFETLKQIKEEVAAKKWPFAPCNELSMGMSQDYPIAIQQGATFVRIGTAFFKNNLTINDEGEPA